MEREKIENQNEEDFINRASDPWLFIHVITEEDFGTEGSAKDPTTMLCLLCSWQVAKHYKLPSSLFLSFFPSLRLCFRYKHALDTFLSRLTCPGIPVIQAKPCQVEENLSQGGDTRRTRRRGVLQ